MQRDGQCVPYWLPLLRDERPLHGGFDRNYLDKLAVGGPQARGLRDHVEWNDVEVYSVLDWRLHDQRLLLAHTVLRPRALLVIHIQDTRRGTSSEQQDQR